MSQQNNQRWAQQNPNAMPDRQAAVKPPEQIEYLCGDCGAKSSMRVTEAVRCKECGHRVMYKPRTHRSPIRGEIVISVLSTTDAETQRTPAR